MNSLVPVSQQPIEVQGRMTFEQKILYCQKLSLADLLPGEYHQKPGNILLAIEFGDSVGIPPIQAIQQVHVISGKPSPSANLMASLVRRAGHRMRVTGDDESALAQIWRRDDPEFEYKAKWTMEKAKQAELTSNKNWRKYPAAMLKARAISEVCRDACPEALCGMIYTPDELGAIVDQEGNVVYSGGKPMMDISEPEPKPSRAKVEVVKDGSAIADRVALEKRAQDNLRAIGINTVAKASSVLRGLGFEMNGKFIDWSLLDEITLRTLAKMTAPAEPPAPVEKPADDLPGLRRSVQMMLMTRGLNDPLQIVEYVKGAGVELGLNKDGLPAMEDLNAEQLAKIWAAQ